MTAARILRRRVLSACAAATIAVTLSGCGGTANGEVTSSSDGSATAGPASTKTAAPAHSTGADQPTDAATKDASPLPTLPPGDPGTDAPGTDDPNGDLGNETPAPHPKDAKTSVPKTAVLDAETVASVAGGTWTAGEAPADSCAAPRPAKLVATRSTQLTLTNPDGTGTGTASGDSFGATGSRLVETVSTHHGADAAIAAVRALERRLTGCHATSAPDPRIGDASVQLTLTNPDGTVTVVTAAAVEGVTFVLSGSGPVTGANRWSALTDIALGSTCVATLDGCH
jgi:hypothetical protein